MTRAWTYTWAPLVLCALFLYDFGKTFALPEVEPVSRNITIIRTAPENYRTDYIDIGRNITPATLTRNYASSEVAIVELLLVVDYDFSALFNNNRNKILDYFRVYFWDINMRFQSLATSRVTIRIQDVHIITSPAGQPFIEQARASDGRAEFNRILFKFAEWVQQNSATLPKSDMAALITNTNLEWHGGLAFMSTACYRTATHNYGTAVWSDAGIFDSVTVGAHELAHVLGAPHDLEMTDCNEKGHIMGGGNTDLRWFFSTCSDRKINAYLKSKDSACLKKLESSSATIYAFSPNFVPNKQEQCSRWVKGSHVDPTNWANCKDLSCSKKQDNGYTTTWIMHGVDNTPCSGGQCFRGRCIKAGAYGNILRNRATMECLRPSSAFGGMTPLELVECPRPLAFRGEEYPTPLDRFYIEESGNFGKFLSTPYITPGATENGDKCLYTGYGEGDLVWTDKCNLKNPWQGWNLVELGNEEYLLQHKVSNKCARKEGRYVKSTAVCNRADLNYKWKIIR